MDFLYWVVAISAIVATSCSKDDVPNVSAPQKSVKFSLENVISTRGWDGMISASKVQLNNCQVFFVGQMARSTLVRIAMALLCDSVLYICTIRSCVIPLLAISSAEGCG